MPHKFRRKVNRGQIKKSFAHMFRYSPFCYIEKTMGSFKFFHWIRSEEILGRDILEDDDAIKIIGKRMGIKAKIERTFVFSAHDAYDEIIAFLSDSTTRIQ